jgi:hypothetical protein
MSINLTLLFAGSDYDEDTHSNNGDDKLSAICTQANAGSFTQTSSWNDLEHSSSPCGITSVLSPMNNVKRDDTKPAEPSYVEFGDEQGFEIVTLFEAASKIGNIHDSKLFRREMICNGGQKSMATKGLGWVYAATLENMLAFQAVKNTCQNQIIAVAAAMFIREVEFTLKPGESFEIVKTTCDRLYYQKHYKLIIVRSVLYQDYYVRMNCWPDLDFVTRYVYVCTMIITFSSIILCITFFDYLNIHSHIL